VVRWVGKGNGKEGMIRMFVKLELRKVIDHLPRKVKPAS